MAIAAAYLAGEHDRVEALAGDHLLDHPPRPVLAWIVAHSRSATTDPENPTMPDLADLRTGRPPNTDQGARHEDRRTPARATATVHHRRAPATSAG